MIQTGSTTGTEANIPARIDGEGFAARVNLSPLNQRVQVLGYEATDARAFVAELEGRAREAGFSKVFLKAPRGDQGRLEKAGMCAEATIQGYFNGEPAVVMSLFLDEARRAQPHERAQYDILNRVRERLPDPTVPPLPEGYRMFRAELRDATDLAALYAEVFASYPFPITDPDYVAATMRSNVVYRLVRDPNGELVGAASAETNPELQNSEMTDFATLPSQRGLGLAQHLLAALEEDMLERDIVNLYTIARARSAGMNRVFYNRGYALTGTLVNNCHIAGQFEDMHVWCRSLETSAR